MDTEEMFEYKCIIYVHFLVDAFSVIKNVFKN